MARGMLDSRVAMRLCTSSVALALLALPLAVGCGGLGEGGPSDGAANEDDAFTQVCGPKATVAGIDVSKWDGTVDWDQVAAAGKRFAFARVSDGTGGGDGQFARNWAEMKRVGIVRGAYQFFRPNEDPIAQANLVLAALAADPPGAADLPVVLDLETAGGMSNAHVVSAAKAWLDAIAAGTGKAPIVYTAPFMSSVVGTSLSGYTLWVANYGVSCPKMPTGWKSWAFWQSSESGSVAGIDGHVDVDRFAGSFDDLVAFAAASGPGADATNPPSDGSAGAGGGSGGAPSSGLPAACATPDDGSFTPGCDAHHANPNPSPSGIYYTSDFGCYQRDDGSVYEDPSDNCIPACDVSSICAGTSGPACEASIQWFVADSSRFGCLSRVRITNCQNGKSVVAMVIDAGPSCTSVESANQHAVLDMSVPTMKYLFDGSEYGSTDRKGVVVEAVDGATPLGPQ